MISAIISRISILVFGTLYPAYASYKAVRTKNVKEYVKWMMYWIVYAFFTCIETFTDIFLAWFPFYYEVKVLVVLWLLSPATKGSSVLYRKFVHPMLTRREQEIDEYLNQAKERGYTAVIQLGSKGVNYATNVIMQTALKTLQIPGSGDGPKENRIVNSRSDYTISTRSTQIYQSRDYHDSPNVSQGMSRAHSLDAVARYREEFCQGSSEEENIQYDEVYDIRESDDEEYDQPTEMTGAARIRELPKRKTRASSVPSKKTQEGHYTKKPSKIAVRGRRRIKQTPESDIYID